ncbi:MAG: hypothetical protein ACOCVR_01255 [Myxococcota bacterium]
MRIFSSDLGSVRIVREGTPDGQGWQAPRRRRDEGALEVEMASFKGKRMSFLVILLAASLFAACASGVSSRAVEGLDDLAVVVRVGAPPSAHLELEEPQAKALAAQVADRVSGLVPAYALEQSIHSSFVESSTAATRWRVADPLEVAGALGSLLTREETPRYERLRELGVDGVLEVRVGEWGVIAGQERSGGFLRMEARLIRLDRGSRVVWRGRAELDRLRDGGLEGVDVQSLLQEERAVERVVSDLAAAAGTRLAGLMGLE